ncbi:hypothetical protein E3N88_20342 [Mikania micrantha]|uniref:Uncharacterized protein n=1 Tax=Mikania micrantha TaxID=192012 RepID=A0A5N6NHX0_9ASTR|nr:hypothetical protein E3N88_20342 [Mikania micrantha]
MCKPYNQHRDGRITSAITVQQPERLIDKDHYIFIHGRNCPPFAFGTKLESNSEPPLPFSNCLPPKEPSSARTWTSCYQEDVKKYTSRRREGGRSVQRGRSETRRRSREG